MDRKQANAIVRETFTQTFEEGRFRHFVRNVVNHLDESKRHVGTNPKSAFQDFVNYSTRLGTYTDPRGDRIDVLVVHLRKDTTLARGRVTLRNFVADYLTTGQGQGKAAVIAAFVSPSEVDWRFSFIRLDYTLETTELGLVTERAQLTPARRYSYLVGANENCHTAQRQFVDLLQTDSIDPTVAVLESAFSVEKVTKEFFEQYRQLFERTRDALGSVLRATPAVADQFARLGITSEDFAKKLLGQIVFLYFLQKKGWFGVERGEPWGAGRRDFIRYLFTNRHQLSHIAPTRQRSPNFFNDILEPLFYEALAVPRLDDDHYYAHFDCRIPFLNGGLFEPLYGYSWVETDLFLPDALFVNDDIGPDETLGTGILDVFDRYNFTVSESEPLETEVAVDPEMLGKVFENLLPENIKHASGTYYTPRPIVHYMCQHALLDYLLVRAPHVAGEDLTVFLRLAERFADFEAKQTKAHADKRLPDSVSTHAGELDGLLADIRVCDPAIGSGAFPVGMMHEIVRARAALTPVLARTGESMAGPADKSRSPYALKRHAIQHSLYGVDEDPGAVEIAKLRLWLSMVVDEDDISDIQPLPNLDYKIMQGNALLEEFDGVRLFDERLLERKTDDRPNPKLTEIEGRQRWIEREVVRLGKVGRLTSRVAKDLKGEAGRLAKQRKTLTGTSATTTKEHPELPLGARSELKRIQQLHAEFFGESSRAKKNKLRAELDKLEWHFMRATLEEQGREDALVKLERASATHRKPFFLWRLHFAEVFQGRGGFDVVIANPPYVRIQELAKENPRIAERLKALYKSAEAGNYDLYVVFSELALRLLGDAGTAAFIQSHKFFNAKYGRGLRARLSEGRHVEHIVYFGDLQIFEGATNYVCLLFMTRQPNASFRYVKVEDLERWYATGDGVEARLPAERLTEDNWNIVVGSGGVLYEQLAAFPRKLENVTRRIFQGIKTSADKVYIVERRGEEGRRLRVFSRQDGKEYVVERDLLHPLVKGGDSKAYCLRTTERFIVFPYAATDSGATLISENILRKRYPLTWKYFERHQEYLRAREDGKMDHAGWYGYGRVQALDVMALPKIFTPDLAPRASYSFDPSGECFFTGGAAGGYGILPAAGASTAFLLALLNSPVLDWFHHQEATPMRGGWFSYESRYIRDLPIPDATSIQREAVERVVDWILWLNRPDVAAAAGAASSKLPLFTGYLHQWVNGLVYQLFFPEALHAIGVDIFDLTERAALAVVDPKQSLTTFQRLFENWYAEDRPLRRALFTLDSIEEVRVVEGKV
jgi:type I restriction-modification system DNA methylase subunit